MNERPGGESYRLRCGATFRVMRMPPDAGGIRYEQTAPFGAVCVLFNQR